MKTFSIVTMTACALLLAAGAMVSQESPRTEPPPPEKRVMPGTPDPDKANSQTPQQSTPQPFTPPAKTSEEDVPVIRSTVQVVLVPTLVLNRKGVTVSGLRVNDFTLYDNDKPQKIDRDVAFLPLSLVLCIQRNANVEVMLPKIRKIGNVLHDQLVGQGGEIAVVSFDHRIETLQDFTNDPDLINQAVAKIKPGGQNSRMIDAVQTAVHMLKYKHDRRKVIVLISEIFDKSSEAHAREVATDLQLNNIDVYTLNINRLLAALTAKPDVPRPNPFPAGSLPQPAGTSVDPTTRAQMSGAEGDSVDFVPVVEEMYRQAKHIFISDPARLFTKLTGGREIGFMTQGELERAITEIGTEIRSQYILSYSPNNKVEGGFHTIRVTVDVPGMRVRTRRGYWMAGVPE
jgi:VWFA-related protein